MQALGIVSIIRSVAVCRNIDGMTQLLTVKMSQLARDFTGE
jgi:hypothetical protein